MSSTPRRAAGVMAALLLILGTGCAPKSPDHAVWTDQALRAVSDLQSEVATVQLVLRLQRHDKLPQNFQQVVVLDSEETAGTTTESFTSVQPPPRDDERYHRVATTLSDASDVISDVRIAVVREDTDAYPALLEDLAKVQRDLDARTRELEGR